MIKKTILASMVGSLVLVGCGGGGGGESDGNGSSDNNAIQVSGKVIDGYVEGAKVFLDKNFNGEWDSNEPQATTDSQGDYVLDLTGEVCKDSAPLVVDVPVGAYDLQEGTVTSAYTLTIPPKGYLATTATTGVHVTPMTSMIWNSIKVDAESEGVTLDCNELATANSAQETWLLSKLETAQEEVADSFGVIDSTDLYSDYIETPVVLDTDGDGSPDSKTMHDAAKEVVQELQVVEAIEDNAPSGVSATLLDKSSLADFGITDSTKSYILFKSVSGVNVKEIVAESTANVDSGTGLPTDKEHYYSESVVQEDDSVYHSEKTAFIKGQGTCESTVLSKQKNGLTMYNVLTTESKVGATDFDDCNSYTTQEQVISSSNSARTDTTGEFYYTTTESMTLNFSDHSTISAAQTFSNLDNFFVEVDGLLGSELGFEDSVSTSSPASWTKLYVEDHSTEFNGGDDNHEVYRDSAGVWYKINTDNVPEFSCMSSYVEIRGFEPLDVWDQDSFSGSSLDVWIKVSGNYVPKPSRDTIHSICASL